MCQAQRRDPGSELRTSGAGDLGSLKKGHTLHGHRHLSLQGKMFKKARVGPKVSPGQRPHSSGLRAVLPMNICSFPPPSINSQLTKPIHYDFFTCNADKECKCPILTILNPVFMEILSLSWKERQEFSKIILPRLILILKDRMLIHNYWKVEMTQMSTNGWMCK